MFDTTTNEEQTKGLRNYPVQRPVSLVLASVASKVRILKRRPRLTNGVMFSDLVYGQVRFVCVNNLLMAEGSCHPSFYSVHTLFHLLTLSSR